MIPPRGVVVVLHSGERVPCEVAYVGVDDKNGSAIWQTTMSFDHRTIASISIEELPAKTAVQVAIEP